MLSDFNKMSEKNCVKGEAVPFLMLRADQLAAKETITTYGITNVQRMQVAQWYKTGLKWMKAASTTI